MVRKAIAILTIALLCVLTFAHSYDENSYDEKPVVKDSYKPEHKPEHVKVKKHCKYEVENKHEEADDDDDDKEDKYDDDDDDKDDNKYEKQEEKKHEKKDDHKYKKESDYKIEKKDEKKMDEKKKYVTKKTCMFKFCDGKRVVYVGKNDKALTSAICSKKYGVKIGSVDQTGEAYLVNYKRIRISKWKPYGLKQSFAPSFFKAYTKHGKNASGVGHEVAQQNQAKFLNNKCWILPLKAYQVWDKKTGGWVEKYGKDPYVDCISFCTRVKKHYY